MLIKVRKWLQEKPRFEPQHEEIDFSSYNFDGYTIKKPVSVSTTIDYKADALSLSLLIKAQIDSECSRCLEPVHKTYTLKKHFLIRLHDLDDEDTEYPFDKAGNLETAEMAYQEIVMAVPSILVCKDDCEGLCPSCGKLKSLCTCVQAEEPEQAIDPRLAPLKDLLS